MEKRQRSIKGFFIQYFSNSRHLWMWDEKSLTKALCDSGFSDIKRYKKGDIGNPPDKNLILPEKEHQFIRGFGLQCIKPKARRFYMTKKLTNENGKTGS